MAVDITPTDILTAIASGVADEHLDALVASVKERRSALARVTYHALKVGDAVTIHGAQKYLEGCPATVVEKNRTRMVVALSESRGRYIAGTRLNGSPAIIRPAA